MTSSVMIENSTETSPRLHTDSTNYHNWEANRPDKMSNTLSLYQLLKEIYSQTISAPATKLLWPMKASGLSIYYKIKEFVLNRRIRSNIYNNLINTWMDLNMPFTGSYVKYSVFADHLYFKYPLIPVDEPLLTRFYQNAAGIWSSMVDPTFEEIKNACVIIVAQTIANEHTELGELLSNFFLTLVNKHEELVSLEEFIYLVKNFEANSWPEEHQCRQICKDFYVFSKRFILVDFPLSSVGISLSKLGQIYIKDRIAQGLDNSFNYLEGGIDNFAVKKYHVDLNSVGESDHHQNIYVQRSINLATKFSKTKKLVVQDFVVRVRSNRIYSGLNNTLKMEQRYLYMSDLLASGKMTLESRILNPIFSLVSYSIDKTTGTAKIILKDIRNTLDVRGKLSEIASKYTHLRSFTLRACGGFIEIQVSLDTLRDYGQEIKDEISSFYQELSTMNIKKVRALTYRLYKQAINKIKEEKKPARMAIQDNEVSDLSQ